MVVPMKIGQESKQIRGIIDTGATGTIIPLNSVKRLGLKKEAIWLQPQERVSVSGLGGKSSIVGLLPAVNITIGRKTIQQTIGIIDKGDFDLLVGNEVSREFDININVKDRTFTYSHPTLGTQRMQFSWDRDFDKVNFNIVEIEFENQRQGGQDCECDQEEMAPAPINEIEAVDPYNLLLQGLPLCFIHSYFHSFADYMKGKNLTPKQIRCIEDFIYQNNLFKDSRAFQLYPILMEVITRCGPKYDLILLDPAWYYRAIFHAGIKYNTQKFEEILYLPIQHLRKENSLLAMWVTGPQMLLAMNLINLWGYRFINVLLVWRKVRHDGTQ